MARHIDNPRDYIISCRVNREEIEVLRDIARTSDCNMSNLLRNGLGMLNEEASKVFAVDSLMGQEHSETRKAS